MEPEVVVEISGNSGAVNKTKDQDQDSNSSPILPNSAKSTDPETQDFDTFDITQSTDGLTAIQEETENCKALQSSPRRRVSGGEVDLQRKRSLLKFPLASADEGTTVCGFVQLDILVETLDSGLITKGQSDEREWQEISRWIKYEQDLEEGSARLGKPHIAPLGHHFLSKLIKLIGKNCVEILDVDAVDMESIASTVVQVLVQKRMLDQVEAEGLLRDLVLKHKLVSDIEKGWFGFGPQHSFIQRESLDTEMELSGSERRHSIRRKVVREPSVDKGTPTHIKVEVTASPRRTRMRRRSTLSGIVRFFSVDDLDDEPFLPFSPQADSTMIMVREGYKKKNGVLIFIRLANPVLLNDVQFHIPTRFVILFLAPAGDEEDYVEVGKSLGTLMSNRKFYKTAKTLKDSKGLLSAVSEFLDESIVLPPGEWYTHNFYDLLPVHHLEDKCDLIRRQRAKNLERNLGAFSGLQRRGTSTADGCGVVSDQVQLVDKIVEKEEIPGPFERMKKPFGGLLNDIRRRYPLYKSDFVDGLNMQTMATTIFLYFAAIAHNVTFGGLMGQKTNGLIGVPETLVAAASSGIIFALFSGQPLNIIAPTGPLLVFDELLYKFMKRYDIEFLPARVWIGVWVVVIALVVVGLEGSVLVRNFTRFIMETFSALISVIFVYESMHSLVHIYLDHPLTKQNLNFSYNPGNSESSPNSDDIVKGEPNTALLSTFLMFGTFIIAYKLKHLRSSNLFGAKIRNKLGDFGVPIGIMLMVGIDYLIGDVYTTKIKVPTGLNPTSPNERGWLISPFGIKKPIDVWLPFVTIFPGILVFFLVFMTVEICERILLSNESLRKGCGLHLDPLILAVTNFGCGLFGFPWVSVATLKALAHVAALTIYSKNDPPGIPPSVVEIIENRVSPLLMSLLLGLSIFMAPVLKLVPMPVLFGVFLYMGITSLMPTQLYQRLLLLLTPVDSHPQTIYVRRVPTLKIHLYTSIQIMSLVALWGVKSVKQIALFFPLILMLLVPIRKGMKFIFTESELEALDGSPSPAPKLDAEQTGDKNK